MVSHFKIPKSDYFNLVEQRPSKHKIKVIWKPQKLYERAEKQRLKQRVVALVAEVNHK